LPLAGFCEGEGRGMSRRVMIAGVVVPIALLVLMGAFGPRTSIMREDLNFVHPLANNPSAPLTDVTLAQVVAAIGAASRTLIITPGTWTIGANLIIPANISIIVPPGAAMSISSGVTLTIAGRRFISYAENPVFTGLGQVHFSGSIERVEADWFGDIQKAIIAATGAGGHGGVVQLTAGTYTFSTDLVIYPGTVLQGVGSGRIYETHPVAASTKLIYTGAGNAINLVGVGITSFSSTLRDFGLYSTGGGAGIYIFDGADINIEDVRVHGRLQSGVIATGFTTACIHLSGTFPAGATFTVNIRNSYLQDCAGDGLKAGEVNNINAIAIHQTRIQGNLGWGINKAVIGSAWSVSGSDVEGNSFGNVFDRGCRGCSYVGNHFEMGSPVDSVVKIKGGGFHEGNVIFAGNWVYGSGSTNCITIGDTVEVSGVVIEGNFIGSCTTGIRENVAADSWIGKNNYFSVTDEVIQTSPSKGNTVFRSGDTAVVRIDTTYQTGLGNASSIDETDMFTRTLNGLELNVGGHLRIQLSGTFFNASGGPSHYVIRLYWGAQLLMEAPFVSVPHAGSTRSWMCDITLIGDQNVNTRVNFKGRCDMGAEGTVSTAMAPVYQSIMTVAADLTAETYVTPQVLRLTQQNSVSAASTVGELRSVSIEKLAE
jgi:hypothetical protein